MPFTWIFELSHPASAAYNNTQWGSKGTFSAVNRILKDNNNQTINWYKTE
jgi:uracil DNA glycosylase